MFLRRDRQKKRKFDDYLSDDSAVEADLDSAGSDVEFTTDRPPRAKRFRSASVPKRAALEGVCPSEDESPILEGGAIDGERLLMRQWLQRQADGGIIPGLRWLNEEKTQIRIPWKHGSRTGWTIEDCRVYQAWAVHTGKIACVREPKKWKANFRCALNSLPDVRELTHLCQKKGSDPFKVYLMLPEVPRKSLAKKTRKCKSEKSEDEPNEENSSQSHHFPDVKVKEENHSDDASKTETIGQLYFWQTTSYSEPIVTDTKTQNEESKAVQYLIPTVVEEFSEEFKNEVPPMHLTSLKSVSLSDSTDSFPQFSTSSSISSSISLLSSSFSSSPPSSSDLLNESNYTMQDSDCFNLLSSDLNSCSDLDNIYLEPLFDSDVLIQRGFSDVGLLSQWPLPV